MAQAPHEPTDKLRGEVKGYSAIGMTQADIARRLRISENTLRKYYEEDIADGKFEANATVQNVAFKGATTPGPHQHIYVMFWLKTQARWKEVHKDEAPTDGGDINVVVEGGLPNGDGV